MQDKGFKSSNIEVVREGQFTPTESTVPISKEVLQHPNADVWYDRSQEKIILVPEETTVQGKKIEEKLEEVSQKMKGFGEKAYDEGADLSNKLSKKMDQAKSEIKDKAIEAKDKAIEAKDKLQKGFTERVSKIADDVMKAEDKMSQKAHDVADKAKDTAHKAQVKSEGFIDTVVHKYQNIKHEVATKITTGKLPMHMAGTLDLTDKTLSPEERENVMAGIADEANPFL